MAKCKIMTKENNNILVVGETIEKCLFLESVALVATDDTKQRIELSSAETLNENVSERNYISCNIKTSLYYPSIFSIAIYAYATWTLRKEDIQMLSVFENNCLSAMAGRNYQRQNKMVAIKKKLHAKTAIIILIRRRRLNWFDHVIIRGE